MSTSESQSYTCPVHKTDHIGQKRDSFETKLFNALLNASMSESFRLYKEVKHGCHCPTNYKAFDTILQGSKAPAQTDQ
jgi:hypothetical protein